MRKLSKQFAERLLIFLEGGPKVHSISELIEDEKQQKKEPEKKDKENEKDTKKEENPELKRLSQKNRKRLDNKEVTLEDILWERKQQKKSSEAKIFEMKKLDPDLITEKEQLNLLEELDEAETDDEVDSIKEKIDKFKETKQKEKNDRKLEEKILDFENPKIKEYTDKIHEIFKREDTKKWIGTNQLKSFEEWCIGQIKKNPSVKTAKETINDLQNHKNGIKPRREFYETEIAGALEKYDIKLEECEFLEKQGLSERKEFMRNAKEAESELRNTNDYFWSNKAREKTMRAVLRAKNPSEQKTQISKIKEIDKIEAEGFVHFKDTTSIEGVPVRKMSDNSAKEYMDGIKDEGDLKKRMDYITGNGKEKNGIIKAIENEGSLLQEEVEKGIKNTFKIDKGLAGLYKKDPEMLKKALEGFETLNFIQKIEALKRHKILSEKNDQETLRKSQEKLNDSLSEIEKSRSDKTLSDKTAKGFRDWISDPKKYTDKNEKIDLKKQEELHKAMTSETPVFEKEKRNIKAYEVRRKKFTDLHKKFKEDNPKTDEKELKKWEEDYDKGSYSERKEVYSKFKEHSQKIEEKRKEEEKKEQEAKISEKEKKETKENPLKRNELIVYIAEQEAEDTPESIGKAYKALHLFIHDLMEKGKEPDKTILAMEIRIAKRKQEISIKNPEENRKKEIEQAVEKTTEKKEYKDKIEEQSIQEINIEQTAKNEEKNKEFGANLEDRAKAESMKEAGRDTEKREILEDYYKGADGTHIIKTEGEKTGEKVTEVNLDIGMTKEKKQEQKREIHDHQTRSFEGKGFTHVKTIDKTGKELKSSEAQIKLEEEMRKLDEQIMAATTENLNQESKVTKPEESFLTTADKIAAERKARAIREKEKQEIPKSIG